MLFMIAVASATQDNDDAWKNNIFSSFEEAKSYLQLWMSFGLTEAHLPNHMKDNTKYYYGYKTWVEIRTEEV